MQTLPSVFYDKQYKARLERMTAYIRDHCADDMRLDELAKMAGFSKYHFHRIFQANVGETVRDYIRRVRLEKAAGLLTSGPEPSITRITYDCGFSSSQHFANLFKAYYGVSPGQARSCRNLKELFAKKMERYESGHAKKYRLPTQKEPDGQTIMIPVPPSGLSDHKQFQALEVFNMPSCRVAYVRALTEPGGEEIGRAMEKIIAWAAPRGVFLDDSLLMGVITGDPDPQGKLIYDASVSVPEDVAADESRGIWIQVLPGGEYGVYRGKFRAFSEIAPAWQQLFHGLWMSGYFPQDRRPSYEIYCNDGRLHPEGVWFIDLCLPIATGSQK